MLTLTDETRLLACAQEDLAAFGPLYDHYFPKVYSYIMYHVQDPQLADDLTAQVFERALTHLAQYRPERAAFVTWLFAIARNVLRKYWRARKVRHWVSLEALRNRPTTAKLPEELAAHNQELARLLPLIAELHDRERHILALKFGAGLSNRSIAEVMGLAANHVGVLLYRALERLRTQMQSEEDKR